MQYQQQSVTTNDLAEFARNVPDGTYHTRTGRVNLLLAIERGQITTIRALDHRQRFSITQVSDQALRPVSGQQQEANWRREQQPQQR